MVPECPSFHHCLYTAVQVEVGFDTEAHANTDSKQFCVVSKKCSAREGEGGAVCLRQTLVQHREYCVRAKFRT